MEPDKLHAFCGHCGGTGTLALSMGNDQPVEIPCPYCGSVGKFLFGEMDLSGLNDKVDSIIAEQASQREALTAILTNIWNKVKDL